MCNSHTVFAHFLKSSNKVKVPRIKLENKNLDIILQATAETFTEQMRKIDNQKTLEILHQIKILYFYMIHSLSKKWMIFNTAYREPLLVSHASTLSGTPRHGLSTISFSWI